MDDLSLIKGISHGSHPAFDALTDRYYDALCLFANQIVGDLDAAEDVVQDTFASLWISRGKLSEVGFIKNYLYTTVRNFAVSHLRSKRVRLHGRGYAEPLDDNFSRWFIEQETSRLLAEAIDSLPARAAEVMHLTLEGRRQEQIGEQIGITVATVKALKADGIRKLKKMLSGLCILICILALAAYKKDGMLVEARNDNSHVKIKRNS